MENVDKITIRDAMESTPWMFVYASEPERFIDVRMTYKDLYILYLILKKEKKNNEN